jgi:hypothetical protein
MSMTVEPEMRSRPIQISNLPPEKQERAIAMIKRLGHRPYMFRA